MTHGTRTAYVNGCRCDDCRRANTRYAKWREVTGNVQLVDAAPVRRHLEALRAAGIGKRTIAARSGVSLTVVSRLVGADRSRPANRVRPDTATRLLAVTADRPAAGVRVDATGTRRRVQALIAIGHTQASLAKVIGWTPANFGGLVHGRYPEITQATTDLVRRLYDDLSMTPGPSVRARTLATRYGWVVPLCWDDDTIDDPAAVPTGTPTPRGKRSRADLLEDFLDTFDYHLGDINIAAFRLDVTPVALERTLYLARRDGVEVRFHGKPESAAA